MDVITFIINNLSKITFAIELAEKLFSGSGQGENKKELVVQALSALAKAVNVTIDKGTIEFAIEIVLIFLKLTGKIK